MYFYHSKIKQSSTINHAVSGNFSGFKKPEIIVSRGRYLEIFTVDILSRNIYSLMSIDFNAMIHSVQLVPGEKKDYVAIGSDSGNIVILEFELTERCFKPVLEHRFEHKVSCRFTPGQHLAVDWKSRALAICAVEETIMFYCLCNGSDGFSVPFKLPNKQRCIFVDLVQVHSDSGLPTFACLEAQYEEVKCREEDREKVESSEVAEKPVDVNSKSAIFSQSSEPECSPEKFIDPISSEPKSMLEDFLECLPVEQSNDNEKELHSRKPKEDDKIQPMVLKFYKWDLKSKDVIPHQSPLSRHANKLISVPPDDCHRGGVLVCSVNEVFFMDYGTYEVARCHFPQRRNVVFNNKKGMLISESVTYKKDNKWIILLQSEEGDLYSAKIVRVDKKLKIVMTYVDTISVASAMCIVNEEFLFLGAECGDHYMYKIKSLGSEDELTNFNDKLQLFCARKLENLDVLSRLEGLAPVINCIASEHSYIKHHAIKSPINQPTDHSCNEFLQLYFACGRGPYSTLRTLRHGVEVVKISSKELPNTVYPNGIWTFNEETDAGFVAFIVVSSVQDTLVLSLDNKEMKIHNNSGFCHKTSTLNCVKVGPYTLVQVFPRGFRYICEREQFECKVKCLCSKKKKTEVLQCAVQNNQIALFLICKEIVYIEVVKSEGGSVEFQEKREKFEERVICMEFVPCIPKAELLVVCTPSSVCIYSVGLEKIILIASEVLASTPSSLVVCNAVNDSITYLNIAFEDGYIQRAVLNENRKIQITFSMKLNSKRIKLVKLKVDKEDAILALSSSTWISFNCNTKFNLVPLLYEKLDCAAGFSTKSCQLTNLIAVSNKQLVFLWVKNYSSLFTEACQKLELTPRQALVNHKHKNLIISLSDYRPPYFKDGDVTPQMALNLTLGISKQKAPNPHATFLCDMVNDRPPSLYDCELHIFDPLNKEFLFKLCLPPNHTIGRMCLVELDSKPNEQYLLVPVEFCILQYPEKLSNGYLYTYKVSDDGKSISLIDKAKLSEMPRATCSFQGQFLIGIKKSLLLCNLQEHLVISTRLDLPYPASKIYARGDMFIVFCQTGSTQKVLYGYWNKVDNLLVILHEDRYLQGVTTLCFWDDDIIIAADVDGYLNVVQLPRSKEKVRLSEDEIEEFRLLEEKSLQFMDENEKEPNMEKFRFMPHSYLIMRHHLGELVISLERTLFLKGGRDVLLYTTVSGTVGVLVPFLDETADIVFKPLQYLLKGKSHFHNRDSTDWPKMDENIYDWFQKEQAPVVIDGNLCDLFNDLPEEDKQEIAKYLMKEPYELSEKLAELKIKLYFKDFPTETKRGDS